ncbi:MAG TPA: glycoside hydrolase family 76 protein [Chloroflexota bacterium]|nr:glycoside hydrolase family 76 protein [Chloroflexota bacterium]
MSDRAAAARYLAQARATRAYTARHLAYYGGAADGGAPWVSYRRSTAEPDYSDSWYDCSQILADAALAACGDAACVADAARAFRHLERHWDPTGGGYFGRGGVRGDWVAGPDKYADDNALAGVALLHAQSSEPDAARRRRYVARAIAIAEYLARDLWDDVFGGGFWWNTRRGDGVEGKPAQSNGLAALLLLWLHDLTGEPRWRAWAARTLTWLDATLWDQGAGLYRYSVHYADLAARTGQVVERRYFNYDQGILIEAHARAAVGLVERPAGGAAGGDAAERGAHLRRARTIASSLEGRFWDAALGGYVLEAGVPQLYLVYAAWLTPALLALFAADADPRWLALARRNVDTLHARLYDPRDGGYAHRAWRDAGQVRLDPERHTAAQAWMQYAQAALAAALA